MVLDGEEDEPVGVWSENGFLLIDLGSGSSSSGGSSDDGLLDQSGRSSGLLDQSGPGWNGQSIHQWSHVFIQNLKFRQFVGQLLAGRRSNRSSGHIVMRVVVGVVVGVVVVVVVVAEVLRVVAVKEKERRRKKLKQPGGGVADGNDGIWWGTANERTETNTPAGMTNYG